MKLIIDVTPTEYSAMLFALEFFGTTRELAHRLVVVDPADDGPEVEILRADRRS